MNVHGLGTKAWTTRTVITRPGGRAPATVNLMPVKRVLMVLKKTALSQLNDSDGAGAERMLRLVAERDGSVKGIQAGHDAHWDSVKRVRRVLRESGVEVRETNKIPVRPIKDVDLLIVVGGDGTVLRTSHAVRDGTPVLGVNSAPTFSVGYLAGCTADNFGQVFSEIAQDKLTPLTVQRLQVKVGSKILAAPVLNDVLFCADGPAEMSRYRLFWPDGAEMQRSSGVWISTPAGSTGALHSAGGPVLPLTARQFAFYVREPYSPPGRATRIRSAVLTYEDELKIECRVEEASVFLDGAQWRTPVPFGEFVTFSLHPQPLRLVRGHVNNSE